MMNDLTKKLVLQAEDYALEKVKDSLVDKYTIMFEKLIESVISEVASKTYMSETQIENLHKHFGLSYEPKMFDFPEYGDVFTLEDWDKSVVAGAFIPDDGDGYWATEKQYAHISVWDTKPDWATHVVWFNK